MINNELKELFIQYKNYTVDIINSLEVENYDSLEQLIKMRQETLDLMDKTDHTAKEFALLYGELEIKLYQDKLDQVIVSKRDFVKSELVKTSKTIKANSEYNKKTFESTRVFSKKIWKNLST